MLSVWISRAIRVDWSPFGLCIPAIDLERGVEEAGRARYYFTPSATTKLRLEDLAHQRVAHLCNAHATRQRPLSTSRLAQLDPALSPGVPLPPTSTHAPHDTHTNGPRLGTSAPACPTTTCDPARFEAIYVKSGDGILVRATPAGNNAALPGSRHLKRRIEEGSCGSIHGSRCPPTPDVDLSPTSTGAS